MGVFGFYHGVIDGLILSDCTFLADGHCDDGFHVGVGHFKELYAFEI